MLHPLCQLLVNKLRFDHQVQDTYTQRPRNCLKRLKSGRLFTLFQPHHSHRPDARRTGERILGQPGRVAQPPDALAQRKPPRIAMASTAGR